MEVPAGPLTRRVHNLDPPFTRPGGIGHPGGPADQWYQSICRYIGTIVILTVPIGDLIMVPILRGADGTKNRKGDYDHREGPQNQA